MQRAGIRTYQLGLGARRYSIQTETSNELILDQVDFGVKLDDLPWLLFHTGDRRESCRLRGGLCVLRSGHGAQRF